MNFTLEIISLIYMILDKYISYNNKVIIALICTGLWMYFRTAECYAMIPRHSIFSSIFVMAWLYLYTYDPLVVPIGIIILLIYTKLNNIKHFKL